MRTLLAFFLVSVSLQCGYLYAVDSDDVEEISDNAEDDDELDDEDDQKGESARNVKLKIANNDTALSANLNHVEQVKDEEKDVKKVDKKVEKKKDPEKELKERAAQVSSVSGSINATIKELEVHMNNKRFDARNRSFFRKLYAEYTAIADYMREFNKKGVDTDIVLAYINIAIDDIYFITSDSNTVGMSDIVKQTISEILFKAADGKIVLETLKDLSSMKMNID